MTNPTASALHDLRAAQALLERALTALAAPVMREPVQTQPPQPARKPIRFLGCDEPAPEPAPEAKP